MRPRESTSVMYCSYAKGCEPMDLEERILELSRCGYACGQILAILLMETFSEENPGFVRCMQGLNGGVGGSGNLCGCMPAGCCMISYFTGKPEEAAYEHPAHKTALGEFTQWFVRWAEEEFQATDCWDIVGISPAKKVQYCPGIIAATYEKCMEILDRAGFLT